MKYIFAGDRLIAVRILKFMIRKGYYPEALFVSEPEKASHSTELKQLSNLPNNRIFTGKEINNENTLELLAQSEVDYILGIHFPYLVSKKVLNFPKIGFLNLHPAYLPYNRGWHTPSWAILEGTPIGATLHFMAEKLDAGEIIHQKKIEVKVSDTADSLYQRILTLEFEIFVEAWPLLISLNPPRIKQDLLVGTSHRKKDLFDSNLQQLFLNQDYRLEDLLTKLRGLTTNNKEEAAFFIKNGEKYRLRVEIIKE